MAVIGINPSRPEPQAREKQDPFDRDLGRVLKGLQAASAGLQIMDHIGPDKEKDLKIENAELTKRKLTAQALQEEFKRDKQQKLYDNEVEKHEQAIKTSKFNTADKIRDDYTKHPTKLKNDGRKTFINIVKRNWDDYKKDPNNFTAFQQAQLVESFKKAMDPGSAVMGGEFQTVREETIGMLDQILATKDKITKGMILTDTQVSQLADSMRVLDEETNAADAHIRSFFEGIAKDSEVDIDLIIPKHTGTLPPITGAATDSPKFSDNIINKYIEGAPLVDGVKPTREEAIKSLADGHARILKRQQESERSPEPQAAQPQPFNPTGMIPPEQSQSLRRP